MKCLHAKRTEFQENWLLSKMRDEAGSGCWDFNLSRGFIPLLSLMSGESVMMLLNEEQWKTHPRQVSRKG